eukprot:3847128-Rhodomonas_salina.2
MTNCAQSFFSAGGGMSTRENCAALATAGVSCSCTSPSPALPVLKSSRCSLVRTRHAPLEESHACSGSRIHPS